MPGENINELVKMYDLPHGSIERLMEVYNLSMDIEKQLDEVRAMNI
ncbi:hypothetical protein JCM14036_01290 [Desulfotomaculum defluvii]